MTYNHATLFLLHLNNPSYFISVASSFVLAKYVIQFLPTCNAIQAKHDMKYGCSQWHSLVLISFHIAEIFSLQIYDALFHVLSSSLSYRNLSKAPPGQNLLLNISLLIELIQLISYPFHQLPPLPNHSILLLLRPNYHYAT